ncbi:MAG: ribulose-phosphate 3-epimerase [Erysipelotrichaceae bacterium]|nr:ribulose-phosphate 3-epimerase [Erysipelotrichaceae bacterium]
MQTNTLLCPSMMCCDFNHFVEEIDNLNKAGVDIFHCDIMDGNYVNNMALSPYDVKFIRDHTDKPIDVHLMASNPELLCDIFIKAGADIVYFHPETAKFPIQLITKIKTAHKQAGIVINPHEPISMFTELFSLIDYVLIMSVNPGFSGQKYLRCIEHKIDELIKLKSEYKYKLILDGACSYEVIKEHQDKGVDGFILGTSVLFNQADSYKNVINRLRNKKE